MGSLGVLLGLQVRSLGLKLLGFGFRASESRTWALSGRPCNFEFGERYGVGST